MQRPDPFPATWPRLLWAALLTAALLSAALPFDAAARNYPLLLTGEVYSRKAQEIVVPLTSNWQARISKMVEEGQAVSPGDVVIEFDGAEITSQLEQQRETARAERAKTERDLARLEKEYVQALYALKRVQIDLDLANLKATIPEGLIGAIEYSENQLAWEKTKKGLANAQKKLADEDKSLRERQRQAGLDRQKAELAETWLAEMLETFTVKATQPGFVIYGIHPWTRTKFQQGDNVRTSFYIAQVADTSDLAIKVWINSVDRPHIQAGIPVEILFDALPEKSLAGNLESISDSGSKRQEWGGAVYVEGIVTFKVDSVPGLLPGMSVLVEAP